jgi:branched-chain amino acid transport system permease protein
MKKLFAERKYRQRIIAFGITVIAFAVVTAMQAAGSMSRMISSLMVPVTCYIVAAIGLNLNVGISGELNLGQAGFMAVGGFTAAIVSGVLEESVTNAGLRLLICIVIGAVMAGLIGWLISIPVLKLQGDYLAIVTLAFGQIIVNLLNNFYVGYDSDGLHFSFINNTLNMNESGKLLISGPMGATGIERASTFAAGVILILVALFLVFNLIYSKTGRAIMACRDNRIAAETVGINVAHTKTVAFVVSSALAGAAGALYMLNYSSVAASKFDYNNSIMILVYVVLGGLGNISGTLISTAVLVLLPEVLRFLSTYRMLIYSIVLIVIMLVTNNEHVKAFFEKLKMKGSKKPQEGAKDNG